MHLAASTSLLALFPLAPQTAEAPPALALRGLDPVELVEGEEVPGDPARTYDRNGYRYAFASEENLEEFHHEGGRFEIQMGGACARMGPLSGKGDPDRFLVHAGRIYVFASDACRDSFRKDPAKHVDPLEPPLGDGQDAARARGRELVALAVEGVGSAERLDALESLRLLREAPRKNGEATVAWREELVYVFAPESARENRIECFDTFAPKTGFLLLERTVAWDDWVWKERLQDALRSGVAGEELETQGWAARHEFLLQMSRELVFLLAQRGRTAGLDAWSEGSETLGERTLEKLVLFWNGRRTSFWIDVASGRVLRAAWVGRLDSGPNGAVAVELDDFQDAGGLILPRARTVTFDGEAVAHLSGPLAALEAQLAE